MRERNKSLALSVCIALLLSVLSCSMEESPAIKFNKKINAGGRRIIEGAQPFARTVSMALEGKVDSDQMSRELEHMRAEVNAVYAEMESMAVPEADGAAMLFSAYRDFLDLERELVEEQWSQIVQLVDGKTSLNDFDILMIDSIIAVAGLKEETALAKLHRLQEKFLAGDAG
jgi:hypothetical protein